MTKIRPIEQIYVALLDENVDVWRPVKAKKLGEKVYLILKQNYDRSDEKWEFEPGEKVICEYINNYEGPVLAAIKRATSSVPKNDKDKNRGDRGGN